MQPLVRPETHQCGRSPRTWQELLSRRAPYGRCPGQRKFSNGSPSTRRRLTPASTRSAKSTRAPGQSPPRPRARQAGADGIIGTPARRGYLQHACVVDRCFAPGRNVGSVQLPFSSALPISLLKVAVFRSTVLPTGGSLPVASGLRSPDQTTSNTLSCGSPLASTQDLNDLDSVEVAIDIVGALAGPDSEAWRASCGRLQRPPHRDAIGIALLDHRLVFRRRWRRAELAEESHLDARSAGGEGLAVVQAVPDRFASVLRRPYAGDGARIQMGPLSQPPTSPVRRFSTVASAPP